MKEKKEFWEDKEFSFFVTKIVSIFRATRQRIRRILIVCSVTVLCMHWEINVAAISESWTEELRIVLNAHYPIGEKTMDM